MLCQRLTIKIISGSGVFRLSSSKLGTDTFKLRTGLLTQSPRPAVAYSTASSVVRVQGKVVKLRAAIRDLRYKSWDAFKSNI